MSKADKGLSRQDNMNTEHFDNLLLSQPILRALSQEGYKHPTDIQQEAIPPALAGKDLLATAQTGTGKTAAFALPILHRLHERQAANRQRPAPPTQRDQPHGRTNRSQAVRNNTHKPSPQYPQKPSGLRALILAPTRELALQIDASLRCYGRYLKLRSAVILGGVAMGPQIRAMRQRPGPDILVATPGRLLDLMSQGVVRLDRVEYFVLDEADRMLDMGFLRDVHKVIAKLPTDRQTMLFSATLSPQIAQLASGMLRDPVRVEITPPASVTTRITQNVMFVERVNKRALLVDILKDQRVRRALVFTRTKHGADRVAGHLWRNGIDSDSIHSNKSQSARQRALAAFDRGRIRVLVATDIAARGIDVEGVSHVINYELPHDSENYVHRIGRTARAGAQGVAMSFCDATEVSILRGIEKLTQCPLTPMIDHPFHCQVTATLRNRGGDSLKPSRKRLSNQDRRANTPKNFRSRRPRRSRSRQAS